MDNGVELRHNGLPDWVHVEGLCPRCLKQSSFDRTDLVAVAHGQAGLGDALAGRDKTLTERVGVLKCRNCSQGTVVVERLVFDAPLVLQGVSLDALRPSHFQPIHWWPSIGASVHVAVPQVIRAAFEEATVSLGAGCYRAAAIMARHALEAIALDHGEAKGSLAARVKAMADSHKLQPNLAEWATEVRLVGNEGAHEPLAPVLQQDARDLVSFMQELVRYLYVLPFELKERRRAKVKAP